MNTETKQAQLISHYEAMLEKVRASHVTPYEFESFNWFRGMEYLEHAMQNLEAVKNGRNW